jgi:hypothetical protein
MWIINECGMRKRIVGMLIISVSVFVPSNYTAVTETISIQPRAI